MTSSYGNRSQSRNPEITFESKRMVRVNCSLDVCDLPAKPGDPKGLCSFHRRQFDELESEDEMTQDTLNTAKSRELNRVSALHQRKEEALKKKEAALKEKEARVAAEEKRGQENLRQRVEAAREEAAKNVAEWQAQVQATQETLLREKAEVREFQDEVEGRWRLKELEVESKYVQLYGVIVSTVRMCAVAIVVGVFATAIVACIWIGS